MNGTDICFKNHLRETLGKGKRRDVLITFVDQEKVYSKEGCSVTWRRLQPYEVHDWLIEVAERFYKSGKRED